MPESPEEEAAGPIATPFATVEADIPTDTAFSPALIPEPIATAPVSELTGSVATVTALARALYAFS